MNLYKKILFLIFFLTTPLLVQAASAANLIYLRTPVGVKSIERLVYDEHAGQLLLVAKNFYGRYDLWSYNDKRRSFKKLLSLKEKATEARVFVDNLGNIYFNINQVGHLYRSANHGKNWHLVLDNVDIFWSLADMGNGRLLSSLWSYNFPAIYQSLDQGLTWNLFYNFNDLFPEAADDKINHEAALKHLHDLLVYNEQIIVGTGDRFRQALLGDGIFWQTIWDEGFTAHILDEKNNKLILGGDKTAGGGLATINLLTYQLENVWSTNLIGWPGFIYSMLQYNNKYYAATHVENNYNKERLFYGILSSDDGQNWLPIFTFSTTKPYTALYLATDNKKIFVSLNGLLYYFIP